MRSGRTIIIAGHYGSGKTEFAVNYAQQQAEAGVETVLADLDIVNPYFRSRELLEPFRKQGIRVLSSNFAADFHMDTPALAAGIASCFQPGTAVSIVDAGGDPVGARVLARYAGYLAGRDYDMWITVNANRPRTATPETALTVLREIEAASGLRANGLIDTTHMLEDTSPEDLRRGDDLIRELALRSGLPVRYTVCLSHLAEDAATLGLAGELFPITLRLRPDWLCGETPVRPPCTAHADAADCRVTPTYHFSP